MITYRAVSDTAFRVYYDDGKPILPRDAVLFAYTLADFHKKPLLGIRKVPDKREVEILLRAD